MGTTQRAVNQTPSVAVIEAVASASGRSFRPRNEVNGDDGPEELPPLYETIDPDALNALFDSKRDTNQSTVKVKFMYCGYEVTVEGTGQVTVTEK